MIGNNVNTNEITECFKFILHAKTTEEIKMAEQRLNQYKSQPAEFINALLEILKDNRSDNGNSGNEVLLSNVKGLYKSIAVYLKNTIEELLREGKVNVNRVIPMLFQLVDLLLYCNNSEIEGSIGMIVSEILNFKQSAFIEDNNDKTDSNCGNKINDDGNKENQLNNNIPYDIHLKLSLYLHSKLSQAQSQQEKPVDYQGLTLLLNKMIISFKPYCINNNTVNYTVVLDIQMNIIDYIAHRLTNPNPNTNSIIPINETARVLILKNILTYLYTLIANLSNINNLQYRLLILNKYIPLVEITITAYDSFNLSQSATITSLKTTIIQLLTLIIKIHSHTQIGIERLQTIIQLTHSSLISIIQLHGKSLNDFKSTPNGLLVYYLIIFLAKAFTLSHMKQMIIDNFKRILCDMIMPIMLLYENDGVKMKNEGEDYYYEINDLFTKQICKDHKTAMALLLSELIKHYPEISGYILSFIVELLFFSLSASNNNNKVIQSNYALLTEKDIQGSITALLSLPSHYIIDLCLMILILIKQNVVLIPFQVQGYLKELVLKHQETLQKYTAPSTQLTLCFFYSHYIGIVFNPDIHYDQLTNSINYVINLLVNLETLLVVKLASASALTNIMSMKSLKHIYIPLLQLNIGLIIEYDGLYSYEAILDFLNAILSNNDIISQENQVSLIENITMRLVNDLDDDNKDKGNASEILSLNGLKMIRYIILYYPYKENKDLDQRLENSLAHLMMKIGNDAYMLIDYSDEVIYLSSILMYKLKRNSYAYYALFPIAINYIKETNSFSNVNAFAYFNTLLLNAINESEDNPMIIQALEFIVKELLAHFNSQSRLTPNSFILCIQVLFSHSLRLPQSTLTLLLNALVDYILQIKLTLSLNKELSLMQKCSLYFAIACIYSAIIQTPIDTIKTLKEKGFDISDLMIVTRIVYLYKKGISTQLGKIYVLGLCALINSLSKTMYIGEALELITIVLTVNQEQELIELNNNGDNDIMDMNFVVNDYDENDANEDKGDKGDDVSNTNQTADEISYSELMLFIADNVHLPVDDKDEYVEYTKMIKDVTLIEEYSEYLSGLNEDIKQTIKTLIYTKRVPILIGGKQVMVGRKIVSLKRNMAI